VRDLIARDLRTPPILPWHHKIRAAGAEAQPPLPVSAMVTSVDDALALLRKAGTPPAKQTASCGGGAAAVGPDSANTGTAVT
jgi:hypothetical protein